MATLIAVLLLAVTVVTYGVGQVERDRLLIDAAAQLNLTAGQRVEQLQQAVGRWKAEALVLASLPGLTGATEGGAENQTALTNAFRSVMAVQPTILQISYLPRTLSQPVIRATAAGMPIDPATGDSLNQGLEAAAMAQPQGGVYVSDFGLSTGNARIPVLRLAAPVGPTDARQAGTLTLVIDARQLLSAVAAVADPGQLMFLTNIRQDFLVHPDPKVAFAWATGPARRWTDLFTPADSDAAGLMRFQSADGPIHAVQHRLSFNEEAPSPALTVTAAMKDDAIADQVDLVIGLTAAAGLATASIIVLAAHLRRLGRAFERRVIDTAAWQQAQADAADKAIIGLDCNGRIVRWNNAATRLFGPAAADAVGRLVRDLIFAPGQAVEERLMLERLRQGGVIESRSVRCRGVDGDTIDVALSLSPVRRLDRVIGGVLAVRPLPVDNASESETGRQDLASWAAAGDATTAVALSILQNTGVAVIGTDRTGTINLFNAGAETLLGYAAHEVVGKITPTLLHDPAEVSARAADLSKETSSPLLTALSVFTSNPSRGLPEIQEWTYIRKDGTRVPALLSIAALRDANGVITGYVGIAIDLSTQKRDAERLRRTLDDAESAGRAKAAFLANMSHEIRTPLNGIIGSAHLLLEEPLNDNQFTLADNVLRAATALSTVINDILDYSRIDAGMLVLQPEPFALTAPIDAAVDLFRAAIEARHLSLAVSIDPDLPQQVVGDAGRLRQVIDNMLGNAVKFTHSGSIAITLRQAARVGDTVNLTIIISDTGIGISQVQRDRLFQPFTQADVSHRRTHSGSGLGLALTHRLVTMMGGSIHVESQEGVGSRFFIDLSLPVVAAPAPAPTPQAKPAVSDQPPLHGKRILLVEDNELNRVVAKGFLDRAGAAIDMAEDGAAAVEAVRQQAYDLILMDIQMPGMDGLEATRIIRTLHHGHDVPIVAMTAAGNAESLQECLDAGMDDHVAKPFVPVLFLATLRRWLGVDDPPIIMTDVPANPELPPAIAGIDMTEAMGRVLGNRALLDTILDQFVERFNGWGQRLRTRLANGQWQTACRKLHELRGAAGNIAAKDVAAQAGQLELAVRTEQGGVHDEALLRLETLLNSLCSAIRTRPRYVPPPADEPADGKVIHLDIDTMRSTLRSRNLSAIELFATQRSALTQRLGNDKVRQLQINIEALRFNDALALLDTEFPGS